MEAWAAGINLTALLADEMDMRRARVAQLKQWLEDMPSEKIPELQFLSDSNWIEAVENLSVTDDEYRQTMSHLRSRGGTRVFKSSIPGAPAIRPGQSWPIPRRSLAIETVFRVAH